MVAHFSVAVPAHNEKRPLPACLHAATRQQDAPPHEIIVVDNTTKA